MSKLNVFKILLIIFSTHLPTCFAEENDIAKDILHDIASNQILPLTKLPDVTSAVMQQNQEHQKFTIEDCMKADKIWASELATTNYDLITKSLEKPLSHFLRGIKKDSNGAYTEIIVMDNKGLNVGQTDISSDYWQGDEDKWQKTYLIGKDAIHIGDIEFDESTQKNQAQVSITISDPSNGTPIGAITVGVSY